MGAKNYVIEMTMDLTTLHGYPEGSSPEQVFHLMLLQVFMSWAKQNQGVDYKSQKMFYKIRKAMEEALKVKDKSFNLGVEEFEFLNKARNEVKMDLEANEAIMRVNEKIDQAQENFEAKYGKAER